MPQQIIKKTTSSFLDKFKGKTSKVPKHGINKILNTNQKMNSIITNNQQDKYDNKHKNSIASDNSYQQQQIQPPRVLKLNSKNNNYNYNYNYNNNSNNNNNSTPNKQLNSYNSLQVSRMQIFKSKDKAQQRLLADMNQLFGQNNNNPQNTLKNRISSHINNNNNINGKKLNPILNSSLNKNINSYNNSNGLYNSHEVVSDIQLDKKNMYQLPPLNKHDKKNIILPPLNQNNRNHKSFSVASQLPSSKHQFSNAADSQFQSINSEKKNKYVFGKYLKLDDQAAKHLEFLKNIEKKSIFKIKQKNQDKLTR